MFIDSCVDHDSNSSANNWLGGENETREGQWAFFFLWKCWLQYHIRQRIVDQVVGKRLWAFQSSMRKSIKWQIVREKKGAAVEMEK